ncbi:PTS sugar transporter subunit IIA [Candidatus Aerophobetes bacterium]|uniref:PTS sugar transporter subunit IIA n=1 Tax=Aerophobetes bacterium TaxID=2030807 RepID=A0A7V5LZA7_UNCAE|nr:PTS sugar transporter subunit IIA [Candidatus Aerophobetes bacterium]HHF97862.1 PTS sugar transporter subunit IIA [Candidatus Aerophobetes bacterium]
MVRFSEILGKDCINLNLKSKKKKDTIRELVDLIYKAGKIKDPQKVEKELIEREKIGTTGIGGGIAVPHIMTKEISGTVMAFGRKKEGLDFDAIDGEPVKLIFLLIGPKGEEATHLRLLCRLSRFLHDTQFKKALTEAKREEDVIEAFKKKEEEEG